MRINGNTAIPTVPFGKRFVSLDKVSKPKRDSDWHQFRGLCLYELDSLDEEVESEFRAALGIDPDHQYARLFLGHVLFDQSRFAEALEQFKGIERLRDTSTCHESVSSNGGSLVLDIERKSDGLVNQGHLLVV